MEVLKGFGRLFYIISPSETAVEKLEDVAHADYVKKAIPYFITLILLEYAVQVLMNKRRTRINDGIVSMAHGMYLGCQELIFKGAEHIVYIKIYENWRIGELQWDSAWTWYFTLLGVDFGYYWVHRACHEVNIFWAQHQDRIFGTFAEEKPGEKIVYGLVEDVKSFNPFWLQIFYYPKIWNRMKEYENWRDKISVALNGPGWAGPGTPRLGDINEVPEVPSRDVYDIPLHTWKNVYAGAHFTILLSIFHVISTNELMFNQTTVISVVSFLLFSLTSIGFVLEDRQVGAMTEIFRSGVVILYVFMTPGSIGPIVRQLINGVYALSIGLWSLQLAFSTSKASSTSAEHGHSHKNGIQNDATTKKSK